MEGGVATLQMEPPRYGAQRMGRGYGRGGFGRGAGQPGGGDSGVGGQAVMFDGKRMRKAVHRKTIDYNSAVINYLQDRIWQRDHRDRRALQPESLYQIELTPPLHMKDNPMNCVTTKFIRTSTNKFRCPIFCLAWTPEGRRLVTGASSGEFTLWNGLTFNFETILQAHDTSVRAMQWSHNDQWMVTADHSGFIKYWQTNMNNVKMYQGHKEPVRGIRWASVQDCIVYLTLLWVAARNLAIPCLCAGINSYLDTYFKIHKLALPYLNKNLTSDSYISLLPLRYFPKSQKLIQIDKSKDLKRHGMFFQNSITNYFKILQVIMQPIIKTEYFVEKLSKKSPSMFTIWFSQLLSLYQKQIFGIFYMAELFRYIIHFWICALLFLLVLLRKKENVSIRWML